MILCTRLRNYPWQNRPGPAFCPPTWSQVFSKNASCKALGFSLTDSLKDNTFGYNDRISSKSLSPLIEESMNGRDEASHEGGPKMMVYTWQPLW